MANGVPLTFSKTFYIKLDGSEEWFDPCLLLDSPLCIDPFLMLDLEQEDEFKGAHAEIVAFFQHQFDRIAAAGTDMNSPAVRRIIQALKMPEARELYLGYSEGTTGAGSGEGLAKLMASAIMVSIAIGLTEISHFEEISILGKGIGPDRISDAAAGITKWRFARYTERICKSLNIPTEKRLLDRAKYDLAADRWITVEAQVPIDPRKKHSILLTPQRFLRHLPTLGGDEFAGYAERRWMEQHREALAQNLVTFDKERVLTAARKDSGVRNQFIRLAEQVGGEPYNFQQDRWGIKMPEVAAAMLEKQPFSFAEPTNSKEMQSFVLSLAKYFKHFIEDQKGWELLWDKNRSKPEKAVQRLMFGIVYLICAANNVSVDPETNAGRGPVDFKFSRGFSSKCLLETKLERNTKWIRGVTEQLPTYLVSDVGRYGIFLMVSYDGSKNELILKLQDAARLVEARGIYIDVIFVDARKEKPSASKL